MAKKGYLVSAYRAIKDPDKLAAAMAAVKEMLKQVQAAQKKPAG